MAVARRRPGALRRGSLATAGALVGILALLGCGGPETGVSQATSVGEEPVDDPAVLAPTRGTGTLEEPLDPGEDKPVLTTAAPGTGAPTSVDDTGTRVCLAYSWSTEGGAPALSDGVSFRVTGVRTEPDVWAFDESVCDGSIDACLGYEVLGQSACEIGFVVRPDAPADVVATLRVSGELVCGPPSDDDACATAEAGFLGAPAADLEMPPVPAPDPDATLGTQDEGTVVDDGAVDGEPGTGDGG